MISLGIPALMDSHHNEPNNLTPDSIPSDFFCSYQSSIRDNNSCEDVFNSDDVHSHLVCPLKPFSHMLISFENSEYENDAAGAGPQNFSINKLQTPNSSNSAINLYNEPKISCPPSIKTLKKSKVQYVSDNLINKLGFMPDKKKLVGKTIGSFTTFENDQSSVKNSVWGIINKVLFNSNNGNHVASPKTEINLPSSSVRNEKSGRVRLIQINNGQTDKTFFYFCAHILSVQNAKKWWSWNYSKNSSLKNPISPDFLNSNISLCVVHMSEITALHKISCLGLTNLLPAPIESIWRPSSGIPNPSLSNSISASWQLSNPNYNLNSKKKFLSLLVSRHSIIEMAFPLSPSKVYFCSSPSSMSNSYEVLSLNNILGESLFSNVHPEDCPRLVKALSIAWDAKPDFYYYHENNYNKQYRQKIYDKTVQTRLELDCEYRKYGITLNNSVVELTVQWCFKSLMDHNIRNTDQSWREFDWDDPESLENSCRFVKVRLCRWPLPRSSPKINRHSWSHSSNETANNGSPGSSHKSNGFILLDLSILEHKTKIMEKLDKKLDSNTPDPLLTNPISSRNQSLDADRSRFFGNLSNLEKSISLFSIAKNDKLYQKIHSSNTNTQENTVFQKNFETSQNIDKNNLNSYQITRNSPTFHSCLNKAPLNSPNNAACNRFPKNPDFSIIPSKMPSSYLTNTLGHPPNHKALDSPNTGETSSNAKSSYNREKKHHLSNFSLSRVDLHIPGSLSPKIVYPYSTLSSSVTMSSPKSHLHKNSDTPTIKYKELDSSFNTTPESDSNSNDHNQCNPPKNMFNYIPLDSHNCTPGFYPRTKKVDPIRSSIVIYAQNGFISKESH
ncbi:hypothetical protein AYI68_g381 [Smittium mucronatum]|uniref:Uncharacterized protein n=1 Tax=Smittium mucronatum TaxID=133383 RepID=A0A1R0H8B9_9FUNG|nr:hypothetical protein AYI68_g381 [Smittium mucronatum]